MDFKRSVASGLVGITMMAAPINAQAFVKDNGPTCSFLSPEHCVEFYPSARELDVNHQVKTGESLWSISRTYYGTGTNWNFLAEQNGIVNPNHLKVGSYLIIPK